MSQVDLKELQEAYKGFFDMDKGKMFLAQLETMIELNHKAAESDPNLARDYVQRAKGNRQVLDHIQIVLGGVKKG
jgi:hypothetical protein